MDIRFALNHMTVAGASYVQLLDMAAALGCVGVEVRNDLIADAASVEEVSNLLADWTEGALHDLNVPMVRRA